MEVTAGQYDFGLVYIIFSSSEMNLRTSLVILENRCPNPVLPSHQCDAFVSEYMYFFCMYVSFSCLIVVLVCFLWHRLKEHTLRGRR